MVVEEYVPDWVHSINRQLWIEDDAPDAETIDEAWWRIFGRLLIDDPIIHTFDGGDTFYQLHSGGRVSRHSFEGEGIYKLKGFVL